MGLTSEESINRYGTEKYTAWDEPNSDADARSKGLNVMQKMPNPAQVQGNQTIQANKQQFKPIKGFSNLQNQYAEQMANPPDYQSLYGQYSQETGLGDVKKLILDIDNTVADIEDKIAKIEPNINKEVGNYLINEGQRGRMVNAEQLPLRTQYADILRSRGRLSAEATAKAELVNTMMGFASTAYTQKNDYLKALMDMEKSNKTENGLGTPDKYLDEPAEEPKPTEPPMTPEQQLDNIFGASTGGRSGTVDSKVANSSATLNKTIPKIRYTDLLKGQTA